jgi:DNA polymerase III subunit delta
MYQKFKKDLKKLLSSLAENERVKIVYLYGDNKFFLEKSLEVVKKFFVEKELEVKKFIYKKNELTFRDFASQSFIFAQHSVSVVDCSEMEKNFLSTLQKDNFSIVSKTIVLVHHTTKVSSVFLKYLNSNNNLNICCPKISSRDLKLVISDLCKQHFLSLDSQAINFFIEQLGDDLSKIENEIVKLSLIFAESKTSLGVKDISEHLGLLRSDHVFELKNYLLEKKSAQAQQMILSLLENGQSSIAIVGILSFFCRQCISLQSLSHNSYQEISQKMKIPSFVIGKYLNYTKKMDKANLTKALHKCFVADISLKTNSKVSEDIILSDIVSYL